ncbi:MAG: energy-converting hydrogenase B subunit J [Methanobacteriaceae archaeon]|jgi:energy-converting hydrogenase B subunit J|nr:MAG: energy-converting hydrogenase B subunit J [Methanobacterium sp. BRmetb2]MCC7557721.1 energy-converting hydrogenase B subunit J [Methanobacteriaceae archaeon]
MFYIGPPLFGFILGFILGSRIKTEPDSKIKFTLGSFLVVLIVAILMAYELGPFPFYQGIPIATGFVAAIIGIFAGKIILGR